MKIIYCDLCSQPVKGYKWRILFYQFVENPPFQTDDNPSSFVKKEEKEVCESCYKGLQDIFNKRMLRLCQEAEELRKTYEIPAKKPEHELKKRKKQ
jgi:hypothetical protein